MIQINFPKEGGQSGYTYGVTGCTGAKNVTFTASTTWIHVTTSSTKVTISAETSPESVTTDRNGNVKAYLNGTECETFNVVQKGCTCTTAVFSATGSTVAALGVTNEQVGTYSIDSYCVTAVTSTGSVPSSASNWVSNITVSNNVVKATVAANNESGAQQRSTTITITASLKNGTTCTATLDISQPPYSPTPVTCECDYIVGKVADVSLEDGMYKDLVVSEYTVNDNCSNTPTVTASSNVNWITIKQVNNNNHTIRYTVNENPAPSSERTGTITLTVNNSACTTFNVTQPALPCDCTYAQLFVNETLPEVDNYPRPRRVWVASGRTNGCGTFIGETTTTSIIQQNSIEVVSRSGSQHGEFDVYATFFDNSGDARSGVFTLTFLDKNGIPYTSCRTTVSVTQKNLNDMCDCSMIENVRVTSDVTSATKKAGIDFINVQVKSSAQQHMQEFIECGWKFSAETDADWVTIINSEEDIPFYGLYYNVGVEQNTSFTDDRQATISYKIWNNENTSCRIGQAQLTQKAAVSCTCENLVSLDGESCTSVTFNYDGTVYGDTFCKYMPTRPENDPSGCNLTGSQYSSYSITTSASTTWIHVSNGSVSVDEYNATNVEPRTGHAYTYLYDANGNLCDTYDKLVTQSGKTCNCDVAAASFETTAKTVDCKTTAVTYSYDTDCSLYSLSAYQTTNLPSWIKGYTSGITNTGITIYLEENDTSARTINNVIAASIYDPQTSGSCTSLSQKYISLTQEQCTCSCKSISATTNNGFSGEYCDSSGTKSSYSNAYDYAYSKSYGYSSTKYVYKLTSIKDDSCLSYVVQNVTGDTSDIGVSIAQSGNDHYVQIEIKNSSLATGVTKSIGYRIRLQKDGSNCNSSSNYIDKTFTLYGSADCPTPCPTCTGITGAGIVLVDSGGTAIAKNSTIKVSKGMTNVKIANATLSGNTDGCANITVSCTTQNSQISVTYESNGDILLTLSSTASFATASTIDIHKRDKDGTSCGSDDKNYMYFVIDWS